MARMIADSYKEGKKNVVSECRGFVQAKEVFDLLKAEVDEWTAIDFYDQWCYFRYTGRLMLP